MFNWADTSVGPYLRLFTGYGMVLPVVDFIKTGLSLGKTLKNVVRAKEIMVVLSRNGFDEFIIKTGLIEKIPGFVLPKSQSRISGSLEEYDADSLPASVGYRLRRSFEDLGPGFIKLGQLLSTREDIFPPSFIIEMKKLQDQVKGISFDEATQAIEASLKKPWQTVFRAIDANPIGTASIGVAYRGQLKSGDDVVIKVRRPNIRKTIRTDFEILQFIIAQMERVSDEIRHLAISRIIQDFAAHLETELDYRVEALNCERLKANITQVDTNEIFYLPKVYKDISSEDILVMEYFDGIPFSNAGKVNEVRAEIQEKLEKGIRVFVHNLLIDGFFHADLHGGNFFLLKNGKIGIIDFGLVGFLGKKSRASLVAILYAMVNFNFENLVYEFLEVADYDTIPDVESVVNDVRDCLSPYMGLTVQQTNFSLLFRSIMTTLARHRLYLPREWFVVFRALVTLDGVGKSLDMDFDIFKIVDQDIRKIIDQLVSKDEIIEQALWMGRDMLTSVRGLPRHIRWFLRDFAKKNYSFQVIHKGYEKELQTLGQSLNHLSLSLVACVLIFCGAFLLKNVEIHSLATIPKLTWGFWIAATLILGKTLIKRK